MAHGTGRVEPGGRAARAGAARGARACGSAELRRRRPLAGRADERALHADGRHHAPAAHGRAHRDGVRLHPPLRRADGVRARPRCRELGRRRDQCVGQQAGAHRRPAGPVLVGRRGPRGGRHGARHAADRGASQRTRVRRPGAAAVRGPARTGARGRALATAGRHGALRHRAPPAPRPAARAGRAARDRHRPQGRRALERRGALRTRSARALHEPHATDADRRRRRLLAARALRGELHQRLRALPRRFPGAVRRRRCDRDAAAAGDRARPSRGSRADALRHPPPWLERLARRRSRARGAGPGPGRQRPRTAAGRHRRRRPIRGSVPLPSPARGRST